MYKPVAQENLWFQGGNLALSRFFSKFVALQIKARMEGIDTPVYSDAAVIHAIELMREEICEARPSPGSRSGRPATR